METIVKISALVIRDQKLLIVKSKAYPMYFSLGGKLEKDEAKEDCLSREVMEEIGCKVSSSYYFNTFDGLTHNGEKALKLICYLVVLDGEPKPCSEIESIHWTASQSDVPVAPMLKEKILPALKAIGLID